MKARIYLAFAVLRVAAEIARWLGVLTATVAVHTAQTRTSILSNIGTVVHPQDRFEGYGAAFALDAFRTGVEIAKQTPFAPNPFVKK